MEYINERLYEEEFKARKDIYKVARALSRDLSRASCRAQRLPKYPHTNIYFLK